MSEIKKIVLLGAGGHCISVLESIKESSMYAEIGVIDKIIEDENVMGVPIIGCDNDLIRLHSQGYTDAFITVGSIGDTSLRKRLYQLIKQIGFHIPNIIDSSSIISQYATLGEGIYIGRKAVVNAYAKIGNLVIINTSSVVEHECIIEDLVHVSPGSILCGNVQVGKETHIGAGSVIKQRIYIGAGTMIGMGSVVLKNIGDNVVAYGNPCKEVKYE